MNTKKDAQSPIEGPDGRDPHGQLPPAHRVERTGQRRDGGVHGGGEGTAGIVQGGSVALRGASSTTTGGFGNWTVATFEAVGSVIAAILSVFLPLVAGVLGILLAVFMLRKFLAFRRQMKVRAAD